MINQNKIKIKYKKVNLIYTIYFIQPRPVGRIKKNIRVRGDKNRGTRGFKNKKVGQIGF